MKIWSTEYSLYWWVLISKSISCGRYITTDLSLMLPQGLSPLFTSYILLISLLIDWLLNYQVRWVHCIAFWISILSWIAHEDMWFSSRLYYNTLSSAFSEQSVLEEITVCQMVFLEKTFFFGILPYGIKMCCSLVGEVTDCSEN